MYNLPSDIAARRDPSDLHPATFNRVDRGYEPHGYALEDAGDIPCAGKVVYHTEDGEQDLVIFDAGNTDTVVAEAQALAIRAVALGADVPLTVTVHLDGKRVVVQPNATFTEE